MYKLLIVFILLKSINLEAQVITDSIKCEGHYRTFHYNNPVNKKKNSLMFVLHGSGGNGKDMMKSAGSFEEKTKAEGLLVVYPDGYEKYWNECRKAATSTANILNINENVFFAGMIDYVNKRFKINKQQVFAFGVSGGGHMVYKLALTMPGKFKAITAVIANLPDTNNLDCVEARRPLPVMIINGTADPVNPYNGGPMSVANAVWGNVRSTDRTVKYWAELAGYSGQPAKENLPDTDTTDGKTIERYTYKENGKPEVVLLKVIGGKHDFPNDINVFEEAWKFFKRQ
ncbi:MAG TPA: poly(3-hydroxybutyrate) depolymerase [Segetibacter sp.]|jgi:polyhydroxybutyrate depolymerase